MRSTLHVQRTLHAALLLYSCEAPYTLFKNKKETKMKLSFNKNNLPWMLIVLASLATGYGYNLLFHVVSNV